VSSPVWYLAINGKSYGPYTADDVAARLRDGRINPDTQVYGPDTPTWAPLKQVAALAPLLNTGQPPPPPPRGKADEIDFEIHGTEMQFVEVELDPGESAVAEAGAMMYMESGIEMTTLFGDGSQSGGGGFMDKLFAAGRRVITGESLFITVFTNKGAGKQHVAFAAPYSGKILPMHLGELGGHLICQKDSFLAAAKGVSIGIAFQKKFGVGLFGGEGFIMQKLEGDGLCFVHAGGNIHIRDLKPGETLRVDTGCLVALQPSVEYDIQLVGGIKTALFGGEGLFFATLRGPGRVWLQSLPFSRLADRMAKAMPRLGHGRKEEGSILDVVGGLGKLVDGG